MSNVIKFTPPTVYFDVPADEILEANKNTFDSILIMGRNAEGKFIFASNMGDVGEMLVLMELAKYQALEQTMNTMIEDYENGN